MEVKGATCDKWLTPKAPNTVEIQFHPHGAIFILRAANLSFVSLEQFFLQFLLALNFLYAPVLANFALIWKSLRIFKRLISAPMFCDSPTRGLSQTRAVKTNIIRRGST